MARGYRPVLRDQVFLLPPDMRDWLAEDHLVWFVLDVVETLDVSAFEASRRRGGVGAAGYDPRMLLALLVYAYVEECVRLGRSSGSVTPMSRSRSCAPEISLITRRSHGSGQAPRMRSLACSRRC